MRAPKKRCVLIVTDQLPGHDVGFQKSGHAHYLGGFLDYFKRVDDAVVLIVLRPKVDFLALPVGALPYRLMGPSFVRLGSFIALRSLGATLRLLAWNVYSRLPRRLQVLGDGLRLRLRKMRGYVHHLGTFVSPQEVEYVRAVVRDLGPDIVVYDGIFNSCGDVGAREHWLMAVELKYQRAASFEEHGVEVHPKSFSPAVEREILSRADNIIAIQWDDAAEYRRLSPAARVVVVPVTVALPVLAPVSGTIGARCIFVGSGSFHNYDGIRWFLESCWPDVRAALPAATLDIYGTVCYRLSEVPNGVTLHGVVPDLGWAYAGAAVTLVPLQIGSGLKVKIVEAFAYQQAVVTTSVGAQGLMSFTPRPFVLADSSDEFAAATVALLQSPAAQMELRAAAARCAGAFTPDAAFKEFTAALVAPAGAVA